MRLQTAKWPKSRPTRGETSLRRGPRSQIGLIRPHQHISKRIAQTFPNFNLTKSGCLPQILLKKETHKNQLLSKKSGLWLGQIRVVSNRPSSSAMRVCGRFCPSIGKIRFLPNPSRLFLPESEEPSIPPAISHCGHLTSKRDAISWVKSGFGDRATPRSAANGHTSRNRHVKTAGGAGSRARAAGERGTTGGVCTELVRSQGGTGHASRPRRRQDARRRVRNQQEIA